MKANATGLSAQDARKARILGGQRGQGWLGLAAAALGCLVAAQPTAQAVQSYPAPVTVSQPDGSAIQVVLRGDEFHHWHEDTSGYSVMQEPQSGQWTYAVPDASGALASSTLIVGRDNPAHRGIARGLRATASAVKTARSARSATAADGPQNTAPRTGVLRNLVVLVQFANLQGTHSRAEFEALFNATGYTTDGAQGSVKDYYREVSYNTLAVESVVADWVTLDHSFEYYGGNDGWGNDLRPREMVQEALAKLKARGFSFAGLDANNDGWVDGLTIIHAGGGEEYGGNSANYIWSHKWSLNSTVTYDGKAMRDYHTEPERRGFDNNPSTWGLTRIGVICHETGHFLGLPDLYDYGYDSRGVGNFCLMAGGSWNGSLGSQPAQMSAWCKATLGWLSPTVITTAGTYSVPRVEDNRTVFRLNGAFPAGQYFLLENRSGTGFDASLPGTQRGLLIWHVDETQGNNDNQSHYMVDLEEASGTQHMELNQNSGDDADYYRLGNMTTFTAATTPNNRSYSGVSVGLDVTDVSSAADTMSFTLSAGEPPMSLADALNTPGCTWLVGGAGVWVGQRLVSHDGTAAAQSGTVGENQESWVQTTVTGPGTVSFWWKVSSETSYDFLRVVVDGAEAGKISGETGWEQRSLAISTGAHSIRWCYTKDASVSAGADRGWVDQVTFTTTPLTPAVYVDWRSTARKPDGTLAKPFPTLAQGVTAVANSGTLKIRAGSYAYPARLLNKPMRLESYDGRVLISATGASGSPATTTPVGQLSPPVRQADGSMTFQFASLPGIRYQVLTSTNLATWEVWKDFTAEEVTAELVVPNATSEPMRFFRVVAP